MKISEILKQMRYQSDNFLVNFNDINQENNIIYFCRIEKKANIDQNNQFKNKKNKNKKIKNKKTKINIVGNDIFLCFLILTILGINIGGSALIRNRTKQKLIYNPMPQRYTSFHK